LSEDNEVGTALEAHFEGASILVCDDLGNETADFIVVQPATRRVQLAPRGAAVEEEITSVVRDPSADREVWIIVGNLLRRTALNQCLRERNPPGNAVQAAYLLLSTISNTAAAGVRLTVYCY
jgi:hypothetical protein